KIKKEVIENSFPLRSHPIQATSFDHKNFYPDEREYSRTSRYTRRDSWSHYSYRSRRSPYRSHRSRSRSRGRSFKDYFTRYKDHYSPDYKRSYRSPEYRRSSRSFEYQRDNYLLNHQENRSPHPFIKQEDQIDSNYLKFLTRQICDLTHRLDAVQAERSGSTQAITPISTDGAEIRNTINQQQISVPTPIETSPRLSELYLPLSHNNQLEKISSRSCTDENLKQMDPIFKQVFRDEIVSILDELPASRQFKITQYFSQQVDFITHFTVPAIKEKISPTLLFTDDELFAVLKQLHKSRRCVWKNEKREQMVKCRRRKHVKSRTTRKIRRRVNGLRHMIYVNDPVLRNCQPPKLSWNEYLRDLECAVNDPALQSAEESDTDEELANDERKNDERPANIYDTNIVLKVLNKPWRSTRTTCLLHRCNEVAQTHLFRKRWHNENYIDYNSRPKDGVPSWWISTKWSSSNTGSSGNDEADRSRVKNVEIVQID
ncbi:16146_t:CDS:2, partial [Gigaspora margarita]